MTFLHGNGREGKDRALSCSERALGENDIRYDQFGLIVDTGTSSVATQVKLD